VLQNLVNTPELRDNLFARGRDGLEGEGEVTRALRSFMVGVWGSSLHSPVSPSKLLDAVCKGEARFSGYQQHDAHELFQALIEIVRQEESRRLRRGSQSKADGGRGGGGGGEGGIEEGGSNDRCPLFEPVFGGEMVSTVTCNSCGKSSSNTEQFNDLSIDIPPRGWKPPLPSPLICHRAIDSSSSGGGGNEEKRHLQDASADRDKAGAGEEGGKEEADHPRKVRAQAAAAPSMGMFVGGDGGIFAADLALVDAPSIELSLRYFTCEEELEGEAGKDFFQSFCKTFAHLL